ncbi:hypothetical protein EDF81_3199 [Enterobacter sp. BIGb0383]|uniref:hypothetical protein n=1 Tax=unclassified Enterobacter TaxID=2608935 RepID=UPI000F460909|nr:MULTISPECIES: hypothetical protein [unclassified Enterobacter]ROP58043.1 hypothetical protein EDF81_3199 [Enterobacter sp. BIGb0383]ROS00890.1 hypothetical protein EC848_4287 [Enterobacter sp. BIGb0359]
MYHSDLIIDGIQADKLMALQLEKVLSGVKNQVVEQASKMGDGATRLLYYTSCFTDNYQDVCAKLKEQDLRFLEGVVELVKNRDIIYRMIHIYFEEIFRFKTREQIEAIKSRLLKAGIVISASALNNQAFVIGITTTVCLGISFNSSIVKWAGKATTLAVTGIGLYGVVQRAAESSERLKLLAPMYYHALYVQKLDMMYFLVEPVFMKARAFEHDIVSTIINMVK